MATETKQFLDPQEVFSKDATQELENDGHNALVEALTQVMEKVPRTQIPEAFISLGRIQEGLGKVLGATIPTEIQKLLKYDLQLWKMYKLSKTNDLLFGGFDSESSASNFNNADTVIHLTKGSPNFRQLRLSGIGRDSAGFSRIIALNYSIKEPFTLIGLDFNIGDEFGSIFSQTNIQTNPQIPFHQEGIITRRMVEKVEEKFNQGMRLMRFHTDGFRTENQNNIYHHGLIYTREFKRVGLNQVPSRCKITIRSNVPMSLEFPLYLDSISNPLNKVE